MKSDMVNWARDIMKSNKRFSMPIMTHPGIEGIGENVYNAVTNPNVHYAAVKYLAEKFDSIASTVIMDLTVEAEAFGMHISFSQDEVPNIIGRLVFDDVTISALEVPSLESARIPVYIKATSLMAHNLNKPIIAGCIGPFSLAGRLYDMSEIMIALYINSKSIKELLEKCTFFIIKYCNKLKEVGANGVMLAEPASGLLSNEQCREFSSVYIKKIIDAVQDETFSVILHNCGNRGHCTSAMVYTGAAGYHFGNTIDIVQALNECPKTALVMGNLDPVVLFKSSEPEVVYEATSRLLNLTKYYPNFVISSGCDIPPKTSMNNINAFFSAVNNFNSNINR